MEFAKLKCLPFLGVNLRSYAESSISTGNRPRSIGNSSSRQRYPHIYDRVANSQDGWIY